MLSSTDSLKRIIVVVRVNMGGPAYTDHQGQLWEQEKGYHPGSWGCLNLPDADTLSTTDPITGTQDPALFQSIRVGEEIRYRFDLPDGTYRVRILFVELYWESSDAEQQAVYIQGKRVVNHFNIYDQVGHDAALERCFTAKVTEGTLEVRFVGLSLPMHSGARACGIEVMAI